MWEKLLDFGMLFDWITPVVASIQDIAHGPSHTFLVPESCGWSGRDIERLLAGRGIALWGKMIVNRTIMFTVRLKQASWAEYLLQTHGIPLHSRPVKAPPHAPRSRSRARPSRSFLQTLDSWIDRLA